MEIIQIIAPQGDWVAVYEATYEGKGEIKADVAAWALIEEDNSFGSERRVVGLGPEGTLIEFMDAGNLLRYEKRSSTP